MTNFIILLVALVLIWLGGVAFLQPRADKQEAPSEPTESPKLPPNKDTIQEAIRVYIDDRAAITKQFHARRQEIATEYYKEKLIMPEYTAWEHQFRAGRELDEWFYTQLLRIEQEYSKATNG